MKKALLVSAALCFVLFSGGAFATLPVPHVLSGSVLYTEVPGHQTQVIQENIDTEFLSRSACEGAKTAKEHSAFSTVASVTGSAIFPEKILRYVNLQCLPKL